MGPCLRRGSSQTRFALDPAPQARTTKKESAMIMSKPKMAILTLHPNNGGGILSSLSAVYKFCDHYFEPTVFFLGFDVRMSAHLRPFKFSSSIVRKNYFGMRSVEIGARWAFWEPGHYKFTCETWKKELAGFDYFFVTSGTPIAAHPLVLLNKKFLLWTATPYDDDRTERMAKDLGIRKFIDKLAVPKMRIIEKNILACATKIMPMSHYARDRFSEIGNIKYSKMDVCGYPVETASLSSEKDKNLVVSIGRFSDPRKNVSMLLRVWKKVSKSVPSAKLKIIGKAPNEKIMKQFSSLIESGSIVFTGMLDNLERDKILKSASLMLITSHQEGLGIIGLEAMANGIPVISTKCGGPNDYVFNGETGFLVDVDDDSTMASLAVRLLRQSALARCMGAQGQKLIATNFSKAHVHEIFRQNLVKVWPELSGLLRTSVKESNFKRVSL
jgi:glycosyltransferase involved in cell wall biosynthesis